MNDRIRTAQSQTLELVIIAVILVELRLAVFTQYAIGLGEMM
jgi:hypothetical protein